MGGPETIWISFRGERVLSRRTVDAAVLSRFPGLVPVVTRALLRLPRRSRLRRSLLRRSVLQAMGTWMRRDFALAVARYEPDAVLTITTPDRLDLDPTYQGRDRIREAIERYQEIFTGISYQPEWLVDLGHDRFAMLLRHDVHGRASGIGVELLSGHRIEIRDGFVHREEIATAPANDWDAIARALDIDPAELARRRALDREA